MKNLLKKVVVEILTLEAKWFLKLAKPKIIAITGSVGKTSTKDALFTVVSSQLNARKSQKSFNSEIGVPLAILGLSNGWNNPFAWFLIILKGFTHCVFTLIGVEKKMSPEWLVLEIGADHPHDIENITEWIKPEAVVVTALSKVPVHVEFFNSPEEVFREKGYLVRALKDNGVLFLNADDKDVTNMKDLRRGCHVVTYGIDEPADFQASNIEILYDKSGGLEVPVGITFKVNHSGNSVPVKILGALGRQHIYPVLTAFAFGDFLKINLVKVIDSVSAHETPPGRMRLIEGEKETMIIDDTYNSSPIAVEEAIRTMGNIKTKGRKILILGDMLELGKHSVNAHKKIGKDVVGVANILITVGLKSRDTAMSALDNGMDENNIFQFDDSIEAAKFLEPMIKSGDVVLVKGSQSIRMEKVVEEIMMNPEQKKDLLVRQDVEWTKR